MTLDDAVKLGLGLHVSEWASLRTCEEAMRVMAEVLELQRTQEPFAVVERVHGQMVLRFTNGQVLQQVADGTKLYLLQPHEDGQKTKYDWLDAPGWANWCAQDKIGIVYWYKDKPKIEGNCWKATKSTEEIYRIKQAYMGLPNPLWKDSLEQRPQRRNHAPTGEAKHAVTKSPIRYIETNAHLIDLRRVQCVSSVENGGYQVTLVSGVTFPVKDEILPRANFVNMLIAYGERE